MMYWKYIKGFNQATVDKIVTSFYTFISFGHSKDEMPHIYLNNLLPENDQGAILTSNRKNQSLKGNLSLTEGNFVVTGDGSYCHLLGGELINLLKYTANNSIQVGADGVNVEIPSNLHIAKSLCVGTVVAPDSQGCLSSLSAQIQGKCSAGYFITTSDKRAKKNIEEMNFDALSLILKTPVYSFSYKDTETPSIGILAQDVQDVNIKGFDLVDNKEASGYDFDYMHVHEGKLVYILWQAIKQQQAEIEELKKKIQ